MLLHCFNTFFSLSGDFLATVGIFTLYAVVNFYNFKMQETRIRYIHHDDYSSNCKVFNDCRDGVGYLSVTSEGSNTVVEEKGNGKTVYKIRLLQLCYESINFDFFCHYGLITDLEVECPVSLNWLFERLPTLRYLQSIRLSKEVFYENVEGPALYKVRPVCPGVETYELEFDPQYVMQSGCDLNQKNLEVRMTYVLRLGQFMFPNLKFCKFLVPLALEKTLDGFVRSFPLIRAKAEKRVRYGDESIIFSNMDDALNENSWFKTSLRRQSAPAEVHRKYSDAYARWLQHNKAKEQLLSPVPISDPSMRSSSDSEIAGKKAIRRSSLALPLQMPPTQCDHGAISESPAITFSSATPETRVTWKL